VNVKLIYVHSAEVAYRKVGNFSGAGFSDINMEHVQSEGLYGVQSISPISENEFSGLGRVACLVP
jgi:hypothetical protein